MPWEFLTRVPASHASADRYDVSCYLGGQAWFSDDSAQMYELAGHLQMLGVGPIRSTTIQGGSMPLQLQPTNTHDHPSNDVYASIP